MGDIEAPAKIGIVMDDVVNNPKVCQNVRNNLNSVITREGRKTGQTATSQVGIKFVLNKLYKSLPF